MLKKSVLFSCIMICASLIMAQDLCVDAQDEGSLGCGETLTVNFTPGDTPDPEATGCMTGNDGSWFLFTTDPLVTEFEITGGTYELFEGPDCSSLNILSDCGAPDLFTADPATTYYILVNDNATVSTPAFSNDDCNGAVFAAALNCGDELTATGDPTACTDPDATGCMTDLPGVWYEFATEPGLSGFTVSGTDFELFEGSCGSLTVLSDCGSPASIAADENESYFLLVNGTVTVVADPAPENDICNNAHDINAGIGVTTCCGAIENLDQCGGSISGVWFSYTPSGEAVSIEFINIDLSGSIGIEVYSGADCSALTLEDSYCGGASDATFDLPACGDEIFVHVTSSGPCGSFSLSASDGFGCGAAESCDDATDPLSPSSGAGQVCFTSCTEFSCDGVCAGTGVWFLVETDDVASYMEVIVNNANFDPVVTIYQGDNCGALTGLVACETPNVGEPVPAAVNAMQTYYVEVGSETGPGGPFDLCVLTDIAQVQCSEGELIPSRPEYPDENPDGPYCPGETVNFCYEVEFLVDPIGQGNNCQWIQGIIPTIGGGWDLDVTPVDAQGPEGGWFWLDEGNVDHNVDSPVLELINTPNGLGLAYGNGGLSAGDLLPGGWWYTSPGGGSGCTNDGDPDTMWGLPASCGSSSTVEFCFDLTVREIDDVADCSDMDFTDLKVHIFTMADGQTGCWSNNSCAGDVPVVFDALMDCSSVTLVLAEDTEICSEEGVDILVQTEDGSSAEIHVEVVDEGNTSGAQDWVFTGSGVIPDVIENEGDDIETVIYEAYALSPPSVCKGPLKIIEVTVYPEIYIEAEDPYYICYGVENEITPLIQGGTGGPYDVSWSNGETGTSIILPENPEALPGEYEITMIVTDGQGCTGEETIEYEIVEPVEPSISSTANAACKNGMDDLVEMMVEFNDVGTGPYDYAWESTPVGLDFIGSTSDENVIIDDENSATRDYTVIATITDDFGCTYRAEYPFVVDNGPDLELAIDECFGVGYDLIGYNTETEAVTFELYYDADGDWDETYGSLTDEELVLGPLLGNTIRYFAEEFGWYILVGTSGNGCQDYVTLEVPPLPTPEFMAIPSDTVCAGTTVTIRVTNAEMFEEFDWSTGAEEDSIVVMPLDTTTYYLEAELENGCEVNDSIRIIVNPLPLINITGSASFCPNSFTTLTAQGPATSEYNWTSPSGSEYFTQSVQVSEVGIWTLTIFSDAGCMNAGMIMVTEKEELEPQIIGGDFCEGDSVLLDGGAGFDSFMWLDVNDVLLGTDSVYSVDSAGLYILEVSAGSCTGRDTFFVNEIAALPFALTDNNAEVCNEDTGPAPVLLDLTTFVVPGVEGIWINQNGIPVADPMSVDFTGRTPGTLLYKFETSNADQPCENEIYNFSITVLDCSCPDTEINNAPDFCVSIDTFDLTLLQVTQEEGSWSVMPSNPLIVNDSLLVIDEMTPAGPYLLSYTLDDPDIPAACQVASSVGFNIFEPPFSDVVNTINVCNLDTGNGPDTLDLDDLVISGSGGDWSTNASELTIENGNLVRFTGISPGSYTFFYRTNDAQAPCTNINYTTVVNVLDCSCPFIAISDLPDLCSSDNSLDLNDYLVNPDGESGNWTGTGPDNILTGPMVDATDAEAGMYEFTFTLNNNPGGNCSASVSAPLNVIAPPQVLFTGPVTACNGTNLTTFPLIVDLESVVSGDAGQWSAPVEYNGGVLPDPSAVDFSGVPAGIYQFSYMTNTATEPCEDIVRVLNVEVVNCNCPVIAFNPPLPLCNDQYSGNLNNLIAPGTPEGSWTFISGPENAVISEDSLFITENILPGIYTFEYLLAEMPPQGCIEYAHVGVEVNAVPEVEIIPEVEVCQVPSSQADVCIDLNTLVSGADGNWTAPGNYTGDFSDVSNVCFEGMAPESEFVFTFLTNTAATPCTDKTLSTVVTVLDCNCPDLSLVTPPVLCNDHGIYNLADLEGQNTEPGTWEFLDGPQPVLPDQTMVDFENLPAGMYTFRFIPDNMPPVDCPQFKDITLELLAAPESGTPMDHTVCAGDMETINLGELLEGEDAGGVWTEISSNPSTGDAFNQTGIFQTVDQAAGTYEFLYSIDNADPCDAVSSSVVVFIEALPAADAGPDQLITCEKTEVTLGGTNTSTGSAYTYSWTSNTGAGVSDPTSSRPTATAPGTYTLKVEDINTGCVAFDEAVVNAETDLPVFDTEVNPSPCFGENAGAIIVSSVQGGAGDYLYSLDGGQSWTSETAFSNLPPGTYTLILQDGNGCETVQSGIVVPEPGPLQLDAGEDRDVEFGNEFYTLDIAASIDPGLIVEVTWTENGVVICSGTFEACGQIMVDPDEFGVYCATITDINGCIAEDCVTLRERIVRDVFIPNIFSPSSADNNNTFYVHADQFVVSVEDFRIFDRWGEMVFEGEPGHEPNRSEYGWNGSFNDTQVEQGVYVYVIRVLYDNGQTEIFSGDLTLVR